MTNNNEDHDVLTWLKEESGQKTLYLNPLNLVWSDHGHEHDLAFFALIAERLNANQEYWAQIIIDSSWRENLVGCVCAIMGRPDYLFSDMCSRFYHGSFVSPQISMAMGVVYPEQTRQYLNMYISELRSFSGKGKQISSAYSVLSKLNARPGPKVDFAKLESMDQNEALLAEEIVNSQWEFWASQ